MLTEVRTLRCALSPDELNDVSRELATTLDEMQQTADEKSSVMKRYKAKMNVQQKTINDLAALITAGHEERQVECDVMLNHPEPGQKTYVRRDTLDTWSEPMKDSDLTLFNQEFLGGTNEEE